MEYTIPLSNNMFRSISTFRQASMYAFKHSKDIIGCNVITLFKDDTKVGAIETYKVPNQISHLYVKEEHKGKGYDKMLVEYLANKLKKEGHTFVQVNHAPSEKQTYEPIGFNESTFLDKIVHDVGATHFKLL